jgi:hypothetical protein
VAPSERSPFEMMLFGGFGLMTQIAVRMPDNCPRGVVSMTRISNLPPQKFGGSGSPNTTPQPSAIGDCGGRHQDERRSQSEHEQNQAPHICPPLVRETSSHCMTRGPDCHESGLATIVSCLGTSVCAFAETPPAAEGLKWTLA